MARTREGWERMFLYDGPMSTQQGPAVISSLDMCCCRSMGRPAWLCSTRGAP